MNKVTDKAIGELYKGSYYFPNFVGVGFPPRLKKTVIFGSK